MNWAIKLRRWTMKSIHAAILGSALLGSASLAVAQPAVATTTKNLPEMHPTRNVTFDLPVQMRPEDRQQLSEIRLYFKTPNTPWQLQERGPANIERFSCRVLQDGEYWYTLALVDKSGRMTPADVNIEPPSQRVLVDTTAPVITVQPHSNGSDFCLRCTVQDANPDHASLKAVCKTDRGDLPLESVPNQPGVYRVGSAEMMRFPIVVSARDLAGNVGTKEVNLRDLVGSALAPGAGQGALAPAAGVGEKFVTPPRVDLPPRLDTPPKVDLPKIDPPAGQITKFEYPPPPPINGGTGEKLAPIVDSATKAPIEAPRPTGGSHQLINTTQASVEYRIDQVGPSGVGKVEIFMTPDKGETWHRLSEDMAKRSPTSIKLPGDGTYGIRIAVANGNGFGGKAPIRGDLPHYTIEVDTTAPFVQLRSTEVLPNNGQVEIRWNATDKNLGSEPVSLSYRTKADGPWQVIAKGVKNDGVYRWAFPRDAGGQFFFKVEVTDQANNSSQAVSTQPVLIDMSEPRATVLGITGGNSAVPSLPK